MRVQGEAQIPSGDDKYPNYPNPEDNAEAAPVNYWMGWVQLVPPVGSTLTMLFSSEQ
jgi:hypothetical protein